MDEGAPPSEPTPPEPDASRSGDHYRKWRSPHPVKLIRFEGDVDGQAAPSLAHSIEAHAQMRRVRINDLMLRLLKKGLAADLMDKGSDTIWRKND